MKKYSEFPHPDWEEKADGGSQSPPSKKWMKMMPIYRYFGGEHGNLDYSAESMEEMFLWESHGIGELEIGLFGREKLNGYAVGKHWMDVTVKMWREDISSGLLTKQELCKEFPHWDWWLMKVLKRC